MPTKKDSRAGAKREVPLTNAEKHVIQLGDEEYRRLIAEREAAKKPPPKDGS